MTINRTFIDMRHVLLTCLNHPHLRWHCKEIAVDSLGRYNGCRSIFYIGPVVKIADVPEEKECSCPPEQLRFAPEELERQKTEPLGED